MVLGKSTLLKTIAGLTTLYQGTIKHNEQEITGWASHKIARSGIAFLPQTDNVFTNLTITENLRLAGYKINQDEYRRTTKENLPTLSTTFSLHEHQSIQP